ncbi:hypothetical protein [uncultured Ruegeria sp.]|uniref:hypothetical protein n=1 Tax=uncultured Ruegeria sp. TaxID=259304 RepID=UPI00263173A4|nr:hypothetical protein [uncultured Ruegeria sp.]
MNFHFLKINRGRYLCPEHGSFCDSSDGYATACPLCVQADKKNWTTNNIDRALQILGNIQSRSQRNLAVASGFLGAVGLVSVLEKVGGANILQQLDGFTPFLIASLGSLVFSIALYVSSMAHMDVTLNGQFLSLELEQWEKMIADFIKQMEVRHAWAVRAFIFSVVIFVAGLFGSYFWSLLCGG